MKFVEAAKSYTLENVTKAIDTYHIQRRIGHSTYEAYNGKLRDMYNPNNGIRSMNYFQKETDRIPYISNANVQDMLLYALCVLEMKGVQFVPGIRNSQLTSRQLVEYILNYDMNMEHIDKTNKIFYWKTYVVMAVAMELCFKLPHLKILDILGECSDDSVVNLKKATGIAQDIIADDYRSSNGECATRLFFFLGVDVPSKVAF